MIHLLLLMCYHFFPPTPRRTDGQCKARLPSPRTANPPLDFPFMLEGPRASRMLRMPRGICPPPNIFDVPNHHNVLLQPAGGMGAPFLSFIFLQTQPPKKPPPHFSPTHIVESTIFPVQILAFPHFRSPHPPPSVVLQVVHPLLSCVR